MKLLKNIVRFKRSLILSVLFAPATINAGLVLAPGFKLQLAEETYLTDSNGVISPPQVAKAEIGRLVRIYRTDGFCYTGRITSIEESDEAYKVYGDINNVKNTHFGFVLAKGGIFAGGVVEIDNKKTYVAELSEAFKGYVLQLSNKYDKPSS